MKTITKLHKRLLIWVPISISCILIFLLVFLNVYSSYSKGKPLRQIMNLYDTYELMIEDEKKLQEIYPEPEQLIFNVKIEGVTNYSYISYIIEGIDYCKNWHSNEYCPRMRNRRIYIEGTFKEKENQENCHFMIAFKPKTNSVYDDLKWLRSGGGGYNPITGFSDIEYTLKDKEKNEIIAIEIGKETEEQRNKIFEYLIEQILSL